jgi:hypothetical protein
MQIKLTAFDRFGKKLKPEMKVKDKTNLNKRHNNNLTNYCFPEKHMQRFFLALFFMIPTIIGLNIIKRMILCFGN